MSNTTTPSANTDAAAASAEPVTQTETPVETPAAVVEPVKTVEAEVVEPVKTVETPPETPPTTLAIAPELQALMTVFGDVRGVPVNTPADLSSAAAEVIQALDALNTQVNYTNVALDAAPEIGAFMRAVHDGKSIWDVINEIKPPTGSAISEVELETLRLSNIPEDVQRYNAEVVRRATEQATEQANAERLRAKLAAEQAAEKAFMDDLNRRMYQQRVSLGLSAPDFASFQEQVSKLLSPQNGQIAPELLDVVMNVAADKVKAAIKPVVHNPQPTPQTPPNISASGAAVMPPPNMQGLSAAQRQMVEAAGRAKQRK